MGIAWRLATLALVLSLAEAPARADSLHLNGRLEQGGLVWGQAKLGQRVTLDGKDVATDSMGRFVLGFGRDHGPTAQLRIGDITHEIQIAPRQWNVQRIDGLPPEKVTPDPALEERLQKERQAIAHARSSSDAQGSFWQGLILPAQGATSGVFGSQRILNGEIRNTHSGHDIAAPLGASVTAPADGRVSFVHDDMYFTGKTLMIDHGLGVQTTYAHLSEILVTMGQTIVRGQDIARVGSTGRSTGPHLHWGVSWGHVRLDPETVMQVLAETPTAPR